MTSRRTRGLRSGKGSAPARRSRLLALAATLALTFGAGLGSGCRAEQAWPLWQSYSTHIIDAQGRVIDRSAGDRTTSEGESYALFFALVSNDRAQFDRLLNWTEVNLAGGDLTQHLPAWSWGKAPDGSWKILDPNPASDADLWLAFDLFEAGRLWREPRYERLGSTLAARIAQQEVAFVPGLGITLLPGPTGFHPNSETWLLNPSYLPPPLLQRLAAANPDGPWAAVLGSLTPLLEKGSGAGFAMDWVAAGTSIRPSLPPAQLSAVPPLPAQPGSTAPGTQPVGSYDAIRVYLWLGLTDPGSPDLRRWLADLPGMARYLQQSLVPPGSIAADGTVLERNAPPGFSAAVLPFLTLLGEKKELTTQSDRLRATRQADTGLFGRDIAYYDQNLALFSTGWLEHRFRFDNTGRLLVPWR